MLHMTRGISWDVFRIVDKGIDPLRDKPRRQASSLLLTLIQVTGVPNKTKSLDIIMRVFCIFMLLNFPAFMGGAKALITPKDTTTAGLCLLNVSVPLAGWNVVLCCGVLFSLGGGNLSWRLLKAKKAHSYEGFTVKHQKALTTCIDFFFFFSLWKTVLR